MCSIFGVRWQANRDTALDCVEFKTKAPSPLCYAGVLHKKTAPPGIKKGWNGQRMAVSPFDGVNRIRFKGSLTHCQFSIADCQLIHPGVRPK